MSDPHFAAFQAAVSDRWVIEREIGRGSRATVFRARDVATDDPVAMLAITRQVADALGYAHRHEVLHKDVKPENIFLSKSRTIVMNLGLARAISRSMEETVTGTGLSLGTPEYMSPEHAQGGVEIDARADLYSLGCVLYEMLAGTPPFTGALPPQVWMKTLTETPVRISTVRDGVPANVAATVDRLLAKAPGARYPDVAHLVDALSTLNA